MADITIKLIADTDAAIPLHVDSPTSVGMTVSEAFIDRGDVPEYTGAYTVTPSASVQTLPTNGLMMTDDVTVGSMSIDLQAKTVNPSTTAATVSPDDGYDGLSSVTVNAMPAGLLALPETAYSDRIGVAYIDVTVGVDDDGYVDSSDGFTYPVKVNDIPSLPTQAAATITPTTSSQTAVAAKKWTTGAVTVDPIPSQYIVPTGTKAITANTSSVDVKTYEFASVNVPNSYAAGDEGKVVSNGALVAQTSDTVTTNNTYDTTLINSLTVNVSGGGGSTYEVDEVQEYTQAEDWTTNTNGNTQNFVNTYMNATENDERFRVAYVYNNSWTGSYKASVFWVFRSGASANSGGGAFSDSYPNRNIGTTNSFYLKAGSKIRVIYLKDIKRNSSEVAP